MRKDVKFYDNKLFAERFRTAMSKRNVRLEDIAKITGCAVSTASTWRRGRLPRNPQTLEKIAMFLSVEPAYLAGNADDEAEICVFSNEASASDRIKEEIRAYVNGLIKEAENSVQKLEELKSGLREKFPSANNRNSKNASVSNTTAFE